MLFDLVNLFAEDEMSVFTLPSMSSSVEDGVFVETGVPEADIDGAVVDAMLVNEDLVDIIGPSKLSSLDDASIAAISSAKVILSVRTV